MRTNIIAGLRQKKIFLRTQKYRGGVYCLILFSLIFGSCEFFNTPVKGYFDYYSSAVQIKDFQIPSGTRAQVLAGQTHISTEKDAIIKIQLINPQNYADLQGTFKFDNEAILESVTDYSNITFKQDTNDKSIFNLSLPQKFLEEAEQDNTKNNLSCTIEVHNEHKQSNEFKLNLRANAPPKPVENLTIMQVDSIITPPDTTQKRFVVCFDMPINDATKKDVNKIRISTQQNSTNPPVDPVSAEFSILPTYTSNADLNFEYITNSGDGPSYISSECFPNLETATTNCGKENSDFTNTSFSLYYETQINAEIASDYTFTVALEDTMGLTSSVEVNLVTGKLATPTIKQTEFTLEQLDDADGIEEEDDYVNYVKITDMIKNDNNEISEDTKIICNLAHITGMPQKTKHNINDKVKVYPGLNELTFFIQKEGKLDSAETSDTVNVYVVPKKLVVKKRTDSYTGLGTLQEPFSTVSIAADLCSSREKVRYNANTTPIIYIDNRTTSQEITEDETITIGVDGTNPDNFAGITIEPLDKTSSNKVTIKKAPSFNSSLISVYKDFTINNITLDGNKNATGSQFPSTNGGAINVSDANTLVNITNCNIQDFKATASGGAIWNDGELTITGSTITDCEAPQGGAIANANKLTLTDTNIFNNKAFGSDSSSPKGGGIYNDDEGYIENAEGCVIAGNIARHSSKDSYGGGVYLANNTNPNSFKNCIIGRYVTATRNYDGNRATTAESGTSTGYGGAVYCAGSKVDFINCFIGDNSKKEVTFTDTQIASSNSNLPTATYYGNFADYGAAIYAVGGSSVDIFGGTKICYNWAKIDLVLGAEKGSSDSSPTINIGTLTDTNPVEVCANYSAGTEADTGKILAIKENGTINIYGKIHHNYAKGNAVIYINKNVTVNMYTGSEIKYNNLAGDGGGCVYLAKGDAPTWSTSFFNIHGGTILGNYTSSSGNSNYEVYVAAKGWFDLSGPVKIGTADISTQNSVYLNDYQSAKNAYSLTVIRPTGDFELLEGKTVRVNFPSNRIDYEEQLIITQGISGVNWANYFEILNTDYRFGTGSDGESYDCVYEITP